MTTERVPDIDSLAHATARAERLRALAREVARTATGNTGLCAPIEAGWLNEHISGTDRHLLALRWFNPLGPTHLEFVLKSVPGHDAVLLVANQRHPFSPETWVVGRLASDQRDSTAKLVGVFGELARREQASANGFVNSCPTLVLRPKNGPLGWPAVKEIVRRLLDRVGAHDLKRAIAYMHRFPANPWDRTAAQFQDAFAQPALQIEATTAPQAVANGAPVADAVFETWWACVTDVAHAGAEMAEFPRAWGGAIRFHAGEFSRKPAAEDDGDKVRSRGAGSSLIDDEEVV